MKGDLPLGRNIRRDNSTRYASVMNSTVQHHFISTPVQPFGRKLLQQRYGVMIQLPPTNRIEIPKQVDHFRLPAPPQVTGYGHAFVVEALSRCLASGSAIEGSIMPDAFALLSQWIVVVIEPDALLNERRSSAGPKYSSR